MDEGDASKNAALAQAVGAVALRSAVLDEDLRGILRDLIWRDEAMLLFEGQSTDWLTWAFTMVVDKINYNNRAWSTERRAQFNEMIRQIKKIQDLRNWIIHGTWSTGSWEEQPRPRPWGERDDTVRYYCRRSRQRRWEGERTFTVSDVQYLADEIRNIRSAIAKLYFPIMMDEGR